jgi:hypothetical protein
MTHEISAVCSSRKRKTSKPKGRGKGLSRRKKVGLFRKGYIQKAGGRKAGKYIKKSAPHT